MTIGPARIDSGEGTLTVEIDGQSLVAGEKYTILEHGWAVYLAQAKSPSGWMAHHGETRPAEAECNALESRDDMLVTSHPVLVALALQAWWHVNGRPILTAPEVPVPTFEEAVKLVRRREIINRFNAHHACEVPGLIRWSDNA